jgi:hypothetical protein
MNKSYYINEISENIAIFDTKKLKEISSYIKYLKYQDYIDPTLEILTNENWLNKIQTGIEEKNKGEVVAWENVK